MLIDVDDITAKPESKKDLFDFSRSSWHANSSAVPRCDFAPDRWRLASRGVLFLSLWKASVTGMPLTDIKQDISMPDFFIENISTFISRIFNISKMSGVSALSAFSICTPPPRRHKAENFAVKVAAGIARKLNIPFEDDIAEAKNRQRVCAEFILKNPPSGRPLICFDDIVTTGSTFAAMKRLLLPFNLPVIFIAGINNKL